MKQFQNVDLMCGLSVDEGWKEMQRREEEDKRNETLKLSRGKLKSQETKLRSLNRPERRASWLMELNKVLHQISTTAPKLQEKKLEQ